MGTKVACGPHREASLDSMLSSNPRCAGKPLSGQPATEPSGASADPKMSFGARHMSAMLASLLPPVICAGVLNTRNRVVVFSDGLLYLDVPARC